MDHFSFVHGGPSASGADLRRARMKVSLSWSLVRWRQMVARTDVCRLGNSPVRLMTIDNKCKDLRLNPRAGRCASKAAGGRAARRKNDDRPRCKRSFELTSLARVVVNAPVRATPA